MSMSVKQASEGGFRGPVDGPNKTISQNPALAAVVAQLQSGLEEVKRAAREMGSKEAAAPKESIADVMAKMVGLLGQLQIALGKATDVVSRLQANNNNSMLKEMESSFNQAQAQLKTFTDDLKSESTASTIEKWVFGILGVLGTIFSVVTLQPELALISAGLGIMGATGGFQEAAKLASDMFQSMGMPKKDADVLGAVFVILVTVAVTAGATLGLGMLGEAVESRRSRCRSRRSRRRRSCRSGCRGRRRVFWLLGYSE